MNRFPYSVSMQDPMGKSFCGGALIGKDAVLTAAHCIQDNRFFSVVIGSDDKNMGQDHAVSRTVQHPDYDSNLDRYDFGLVFLRQPTDLDVPLVRLNADDEYPEEGEMATTMGWGDMDAGSGQVLPSMLMAVDLEVMSNRDCRDAERDEFSYERWIFDDMLCTYTEGKDACQGDSGGPLVMKGTGKGGDDGLPEGDVLIGLVSWGVRCAYLPGVFSRVSAGYEWIQETVCQTSRSPPASLCGEIVSRNDQPLWSIEEGTESTPDPTKRELIASIVCRCYLRDHVH